MATTTRKKTPHEAKPEKKQRSTMDTVSFFGLTWFGDGESGTTMHLSPAVKLLDDTRGICGRVMRAVLLTANAPRTVACSACTAKASERSR